MGRRLFAVLVVAGLAVSASARAAPEVQLVPKAMNAVTAITDATVRVRCSVAPQGQAFESLGHADWLRQRIEVAPFVCLRVDALAVHAEAAYSHGSFLQAQALLILVHEAVHLSDYEGRTDEALTECRAIQLVRAAALALGVDDPISRALGHEAMRYDAQLPGLDNWMVGLHELPNYHSPACHDGGPLDIHPDSNDWPN